MSPPFPHLRVERFFEVIDYKKKGSPITLPPGIDLNRSDHGRRLQRELETLRKQYQKNIENNPPEAHVLERGLTLEFESSPDFQLATEKLDNKSFQLLNLDKYNDNTGKLIYMARVFIADGQLDKLEKKILDYLGPENKRHKQPNQALLDNIARIRQAAVRELWVEAEPFPETDSSIWWEVWLRIPISGPKNRSITEEQFKIECERLGVVMGQGRIEFPEHTIVMVKGSPGQLGSSIHLLNCIAELRKPREFADFFDALPSIEQKHWIDSLVKRIVRNQNPSTHICLLDTGVNIGNPLLEAVLKEGDSLTINDEWGTADYHDHGTCLASLSIFGDLAEVLVGSGDVNLSHGFESVKIVPPRDNDDEDFAAYFTQQGVYTAQVKNGYSRRRIYCLASTFKATDTGKPSSWSTVLDMLSAGSDDVQAPKRLFVVGVGNIDFTDWSNYPQSNDNNPVETPAQSWNALTVGGYTNKTRLVSDNSEMTVVALNGALAPSSRTGVAWSNHKDWPLKPDVVFRFR